MKQIGYRIILLVTGFCIAISASAVFGYKLSRKQDVTKSVSVEAKSGPLKGITAYTDSFALFIGISDYANDAIPHLPSAENDATTIRNILVDKFGFNPDPAHTVVLLGKQATRNRIVRELSNLADTHRVKPTDRVLVYFSGHGQRVPLPNGEATGYLIPQDATINLNDVSNPSEYQDSCLDMEDIVKRLTASPALHRALWLDACFSGFATGSKGFGDGKTIAPDTLKRFLAQRGLCIMTAGTSEDEASASTSRTGLSPFTRAIRDSLEKADLGNGTFCMGEMASDVKTRTRDFTAAKQNPQYGVKDGVGEMILFPSSGLSGASVSSEQKAVNPESSFTGQIRITSQPSGSLVYIDGQKVGSTPYLFSEDLITAASKTVEVAVRHADYQAAGRSGVVLNRGKILSLDFTLTAIVSIKAEPEGPVAERPSGAGHPFAKLNPKALAAGVDMIYVPGGAFTMGAKPRTVTLSAYWLAKTPVTVAQFRAYTEDARAGFDWAGRKPAWGWIDGHPMVNVTWDEARAYCKWAGGDLPTEAQWERAARGTEGLAYPWGNDWNATLSINSVGTTRNGTAPVNRRDHIYATALGHTDMSGNVWQWCLDYYQTGYGGLPSQDPDGPSTGSTRVVRGGSWNFKGPVYFRSAYRLSTPPAISDCVIGFRVAGL